MTKLQEPRQLVIEAQPRHRRSREQEAAPQDELDVGNREALVTPSQHAVDRVPAAGRLPRDLQLEAPFLLLVQREREERTVAGGGEQRASGANDERQDATLQVRVDVVGERLGERRIAAIVGRLATSQQREHLAVDVVTHPLQVARR